MLCQPVPASSGACGGPTPDASWKSWTPQHGGDIQLSAEKRELKSDHKWISYGQKTKLRKGKIILCYWNFIT